MTAVAMPRHAGPSPRAALSRIERHHVIEWYLAGALIAFVMPLVGASLLGLHHDLYLLVYFTLAGTFVASFLAHSQLDWRGWLRTRLWWSVGTGAVVGAAIVRNVMSEASTPHPSGSFYWFELVWRGGLYGVVDALMLFVFPATVAYLLLRDENRRRHLRFAALTMVLSMGITATYHVGYPQFRGADLAQPEIGAVIATVPTALTGNPVGAIVAHSVYHVGANVHTCRGATYLPPDLDGYAERGAGAVGVGLAAFWIVFAGAVIYVQRRRLFPSGAR